MSTMKCPTCGGKMKRHGKTSAGKQRWQCMSCKMTTTHKINNDAKQLSDFLKWLFGKKTQDEMSSSGRTFRNKTSKFWKYWALPPLVDEIHRVVYVDGIHLGRKAVVLIACSDEYVLGWYLARQECSRSWKNLLKRIAPPDVVVTDGGQGFQKACREIWPDTLIQRCTFHIFCQIKRYTTSNPRLPAGMELLDIAKDLLYVKNQNQAALWLKSYFQWSEKWNDFLEEKSFIDGREVFTHNRLRKARSSLGRLINSNHLFTYLDDLQTIAGSLPATNNKIEGKINSQLREMLRIHRGLSVTREIKAIFWWCYMHTEAPLKPAELLKVMPTDNEIEEIYQSIKPYEKLYSDIPKWGDVIMWSELHHIDYSHQSFRHDWD